MKTGKRVAPKNAKSGSSKNSADENRNPPKRVKKRRSKLKLTLSIIGGILLVSAALLAYFFWPKEPDLPPLPSLTVSYAPLPQDSDAPSRNPDDPSEPVTSEIQWNRDVRTVLLVGKYDGEGNGSNTDTIMLAALNYKKNTLDVVSIQRDTTIQIDGKRVKINSVFGRGGGTKDNKGMEALNEEIFKLLGVNGVSTVYVRSNAFTKLVDAVGGIKFNVPMSISKPSENIDLKAGERTLNGEQALMLMRYRGYASSAKKLGIDHDDFGRMQMQQEFLKAAAQQVLVPKNVTKIPEFLNIINENVTTSLIPREMSFFADSLMEIMKKNPDGINFYTLPTMSYETKNEAGKVTGSYQYLIPDQALEILQHINPYTTPITRDMMHVDYIGK